MTRQTPLVSCPFDLLGNNMGPPLSCFFGGGGNCAAFAPYSWCIEMVTPIYIKKTLYIYIYVFKQDPSDVRNLLGLFHEFTGHSGSVRLSEATLRLD